MPKHTLDRPKTVTTAMTTRAIAIEHGKNPNPATVALQRRNRKRDWDQRAKFYTKFARSEQT